MKQSCLVPEIMSAELVTLQIQDSLLLAEKLLNENKIRHIPVVDNGKMVGILSRSDLLRVSHCAPHESGDFIEAKVHDGYSVAQVMTREVVTVDVETPIMEVVEILARQSFHSLPVTQGGELVGIVTSTDLIKYLLDQYYILYY